MPEFVVRDMTGHELSTASLHGKLALVDFWATWCQPCKKEMPGYQKLLDRYGSEGFAVVGFKATMMMDTEDPLQFATEDGVRYPLAIASATIADKFVGLVGLPTTFIYDRGGALRQKIIGFEYTETIESEIKTPAHGELRSIWRWTRLNFLGTPVQISITGSPVVNGRIKAGHGGRPRT